MFAMKGYANWVGILIFLGLFSCNRSEKITRLLESRDKEDLIVGAYKAGESGEKKYVVLLLENADDPRTSTSLKFKGFSVYQQRMIALKKIYKMEPPVKITNWPDSVVIKFFDSLYKR